MLPRASLDDVCMMYLLKADSFRILYGVSRDLFFVQHVHIYIYIYRLLPGVCMSQMVDVFYMSFMCLYLFIYNEPCLILTS